MLTKYFLLISNQNERQWPYFLKETLRDLGELAVLPEEEAKQDVARNNYDLIIIDAGAVREAVSLIVSLRAKRTDSRILVVTASPTWQAARAVLKAGAIDYIGKLLDKKELHAKIAAVLELPLPCFNPLKPHQGGGI